MGLQFPFVTDLKGIQLDTGPQENVEDFLARLRSVTIFKPEGQYISIKTSRAAPSPNTNEVEPTSFTGRRNLYIVG